MNTAVIEREAGGGSRRATEKWNGRRVTANANGHAANGHVARNGNGRANGAGAVSPGPVLRLATDDQLVAAVREGSAPAFEIIYQRHSPELFGLCRRMLGSQQGAEDALQQTFLKAYGALGVNGNGIVLRPWLWAIARNECVSTLRRREHSELDQDRLPDLALGPAAEAEQREELRLALADMSRLPAEQRAALVLSGFGGLSGDEAGHMLGCDREKVKSLVFRARKSLGDSRKARETSCGEIREQLRVLRGGSLRRKVLREHLRCCADCRAYRRRLRS